MSEKLNPKVSIICGVYNEGETFEKHLTSLVNQIYKNKEIIIVDDGSVDRTSEIGKKFAKKYRFIKYFLLSHIDGYGCVRPRLEAIKHARGQVLCMVDADAYYDKNYIKLGVRRLFSDPMIGAVVPRMHFWDPKTFISKYKSLLYEIKFNNLNIINREIQEAKHSPWILRRDVYDKVGGYNINDAYCEDVRLAKKILDWGYKMVHEGSCHWYHKLEESFSDVIKKNFNIGRMYSSGRNYSIRGLLKLGYFILPLVILLLSLFIRYKFLILLFLHALPIFFNSFRTFYMARNMGGRYNSFYSVFVTYVVNMPYVLGVFYGFFSPYKK